MGKLRSNSSIEVLLSDFVASANLVVSPTLNLAAFFVQIFMLKLMDF